MGHAQIMAGRPTGADAFRISSRGPVLYQREQPQIRAVLWSHWQASLPGERSGYTSAAEASDTGKRCRTPATVRRRIHFRLQIMSRYTFTYLSIMAVTVKRSAASSAIFRRLSLSAAATAATAESMSLTR